MLVVLEVEDISGVAGHGVDEPGDDLVQVLVLLVVDDQGGAEGEGVGLPLLLDVNVLVDAFSHLEKTFIWRLLS